MSVALVAGMLTIALDAGVVAFALIDASTLARGLALVALHAVACLLFARSFVALLPEAYRSPRNRATAFVFGSVLFVPVLMMLGFLCSLLPALCRQRELRASAGWLHPAPVCLPSQAVGPQAAHPFAWAGSLAGTLQNAPDPNKRMAALVATLSIKEQDAIPLWRWALKDPEDEVRLLAYSLLNRKERAIEARIRQAQDQLDAATACDFRRAFELNKALAHDLWALSQLASSRSTTQLALCARARERSERALALEPADGGTRLLLARILIVQRELAQAQAELQRARAEGVDARQIEPLLAEMAFIDRQYHAVGHHLARTRPGRSLPRMGGSAKPWEGAGHAAIAA
ncbi:MAG: tetratricopeptide repeat protein [Hydrogenophaga sp.]|nr:tetratricopeptide repeat protein [Hydrogenophaga sp.]